MNHAAARTFVTLLSASVVVVACTSGHHEAIPPAATGAPASSTTRFATSVEPSSTMAATTTTTRLAAQRLLAALRSDRFEGADLPGHLHVVGVGPWQYVDAGHVGRGYLGSAQVSLRSDDSGESIDGVYDVFTTHAAASVVFAQAYSNFRRYAPVIRGSVRVLRLNPPVDAFCGPQAPANSTTCWFVHGSTAGIVDATIPSSTDGDDSQVVVQAMLTHLLALAG